MNNDSLYGQGASLTKKSPVRPFWNRMSFTLLICMFMALCSVTTWGQDDNMVYDSSRVTVRSEQAPPPLPDYVQPPCPADGYIWTPGYWSWATGGYYWVPGIWVMPPAIGLLWTPGYWDFFGGFYRWHTGYWGLQVGYYGGINYGFGYFGTGFWGGRWEGDHFMYNTAVWRVNKNIHNTYVSRDGFKDNKVRTSFNGPGGIRYRANDDERGMMRQERTAPGRDQIEHERSMSNHQGQFYNDKVMPRVHSMSMPGGMRFDAQGRGMGMMRGGGGGGGRRR